FSADVAGILSATSLMALWQLPTLSANGEGEVYIGIVALLLAVAPLVMRPPSGGIETRGRLRAVRRVVSAIAVVYGLITFGTLFGAWSIALGPLKISASQTVQPLSITVLCLLLLALTSRAFLDAFERRSTYAYYSTAAFLTWALTLGPR